MSLIPVAYGDTPTEYGIHLWTGGLLDDQDWSYLDEMAVITATPVDPVSQLWMQQAADPPPSPWIPTSSPTGVIELMSFQGAPSGPTICSLLRIVPGLGAWIGLGCSVMSMAALAVSVGSFFRSFKKTMFAVYFGRRLLGLMAQEGLDEFMKSTKRDVRSRIRIRRSS